MKPELPVLSPEQLLVHAQWVRRLARQLVSDPDLAEDAVQETWVAAMRQPPRGDASSPSVRAWLAQVLRRSLLQVFRGESRRADRELLATRDEAQTAPTDQALFDQVDSQRLLVQEVLELAEPMRSTVILRYFKDQSSAEIARQQGVPAATVRSRLSRALDELRIRMDTRYDGNRSAWCLALGASIEPMVPLAPMSTGTTAASGSSLGKGILAMKVGTAIALTVGIAAFAVLGIALSGSDEVGASMEAKRSDEVLALPTEDVTLATPSSVPNDQRLVIETEPEPLEVEPVAAPIEVAAPNAIEPPVFSPSTLIARFTDMHGNALAGVEWSPRNLWTGDIEGAKPVLSDSDGTARLEVEMSGNSREFGLAHTLEGYASGVREATARAGAEINMGTIELSYSVLITGRVVDEEGRPIRGAKVFAWPSDQEGVPEGQLLRIGPGMLGEFGALRRVTPIRTEEDGSFELTAPVAQSVRVYAKAEGTRYGWTAPLELAHGSPILDQLIVLTRSRDEDHIAGTVLDSHGKPIPNMLISFSFSDESLLMTSGMRSDKNGAFDLVLTRNAPHSFRVDGNDETPGIAVAPSVEPGTLDLVLQLEEVGTIGLYVQTEKGEPIREFALLIREIAEFGSSSRGQVNQITENGFVSFPAPSERFEFEVSSRGYVTATVGPFDLATYPSQLVCALVSTPGIRGKVVHGDGPIVGAEVSLLGLAPKNTKHLFDGFPNRFGWRGSDETVTDENGEFSVFASADGQYIVHVKAVPGLELAAVESETLRVFVAEPIDGLRLQPKPTGSLTVSVRVPAGRDPAGIIVGITDCGLDRRTLRTDEHGKVRFDGLREGNWFVMESEAEISPSGGTSSSSSDGSDYEVPFNCEVRSGQVTDFELVL